jgi:hypothetical protein
VTALLLGHGLACGAEALTSRPSPLWPESGGRLSLTFGGVPSGDPAGVSAFESRAVFLSPGWLSRLVPWRKSRPALTRHDPAARPLLRRAERRAPQPRPGPGAAARPRPIVVSGHSSGDRPHSRGHDRAPKRMVGPDPNAGANAETHLSPVPPLQSPSAPGARSEGRSTSKSPPRSEPATRSALPTGQGHSAHSSRRPSSRDPRPRAGW